MTLTEVTKQIFDLSNGGHLDGKRFTLHGLQEHICQMLQDGETSETVIEIALPDGLWPCTISWLPQFGRGFYDYRIPDSRNYE